MNSISIGGGGGRAGGGSATGAGSSSSSWVTPTSVSTSGKRIQREMAELSMDPPPDCSAGPKGDNLYHWISTFFGPPGTPYEGDNNTLAPGIAHLYLADRAKHDELAAEWTVRFAK